MLFVWSVALFLFAAATDGGAMQSASPTAPATTWRSPASIPLPHVCVQRFGGSRAAKARPTYITVAYGEGPPREIGSVVSKELKCFELAPGPFTVRFNSNSVSSPPAAADAPEVCGERITSSAMRTGWIGAWLIGQPGTPAGCPWSLNMVRGVGALPTLDPRPTQMTEKDFVVLPAIASYAEARRVAGAAARGLGLKVDLRRARPDGHGGLIFSAADCKANDWDYPCYVARGRYDDGAYVSIDEAARFFDDEEEGYLVILASGPKGDPLAQAVAKKALALFPAAELRTDAVSEACIH